MARTTTPFYRNSFMQKVSAFTGSSILVGMPAFARLLHGSGSHLQLTLTIFFVGSIVGELLAGPLSKMIGCKQIFFLGAAFYLVSAIVIRFSTVPSLLMAARSLQAIGALASIAVTLYSFYTAAPVLPIKALTNPAMGFRHFILVLTIGIVMGSLSNRMTELTVFLLSLPTAVATLVKPLGRKFATIFGGQLKWVANEQPLFFAPQPKVAQIYARNEFAELASRESHR